MKKMKSVKSAFMTALALMMASPTSVSAAGTNPTYGTTQATIDKTKKGSITLYKYVDNNGTTVDAEGINYVGSATDMLAAVRQQLGDNDVFAEKGVQFRALKVADIDQVTETTANGLSVTGTYYTNIDSEFFKIMNQYLGDDKLVASESTRVTDKRVGDDTSNVDDHYETDELNEKMQTVNRKGALADGSTSVTGEVALNRYLRSNNSTISFDTTDENGYTKIENLDLGLYLICETDYEHMALSKHDTYWEYVADGKDDALTGDRGDTEDAGTENSGLTAGGNNAGGSQYADIASPSSPFLISVPMTNLADIEGDDGVTHIAGTAWQYDITAYPKNSTINIHKDIVTNDFAGTTIGGTVNDGLKGVDGNDVAADKTTCNMVQTNYLPTDGTEDKIDGSQKSGLVHQIDANIGDVITQLVSVDVPRLTDDLDNEQPTDQANSATATRKHNKTFIVSDRMTKGLNLIDHQSFKVTLTTGAWNDYTAANTLTFAEGDDYKLDIAADKMSYVLTILPQGLAKMDDIKAASYLYVKYDVELTKDALIGTDTYGNQRIVTKAAPSTEENVSGGELADQLVVNQAKTDTTYMNENNVSHPEAGNQNTAKLTYATDRTMEHDYYSNTTRVYTYELDLTKLFTDGTAGHVSKNDTNATKNSASFDYSAVKFTVRGSTQEGSEDYVANHNEKWEELHFIKLDDGYYRVLDEYSDQKKYDDYSATDTLEQPSGEKTVTKYLTPNSKTGLLSIIGLDARQYEFTEVATAKGRNLMAEKFYAELIAPVVNGKTLENGKIEHAYVYTGETRTADSIDLANVNVNLDRMNEGRVPFTVQNNEVIKILKTGGAGRIVLYVVGGVAIVGVICGGLYLKKKKKDEPEDEDSDDDSEEASEDTEDKAE